MPGAAQTAPRCSKDAGAELKPPTATPSPSTSEEKEEEETHEAPELKPQTPKKDLLEIDRFTICGNRID